MTTKLIIVCRGDKTTSFDREYYTNVHVPLAVSKFPGCIGCEVLYPVEVKDWLSAGVYEFATEEHAKTAYESAPNKEVWDDIPNFTSTNKVEKSLFVPFKP